ncbi:MAG: RluA family pseudouridine synthase [Bullifex sp.]
MDFILPYREAEEILRKEIGTIMMRGAFDAEGRHPVSHAFDDKGIMLGLLTARTATGETVILRAFSGALDGVYTVKGYVPPCFSAKAFEETVSEYDTMLHCYSDRIDHGEKDLVPIRRSLSNECLDRIRSLYRFSSLRGSFGFDEIKANYVTGMGDCAAVKLLSYCFRKGFTPISLAEIFVGRDSDTRKNGVLYPPCDEKCRPLMKHLLSLDLIYSDESVAIINKEAGMLSTPGKGDDKYDSASVRIKELFPDSPSLPSCHRLDMDTSGIMVFAKTEKAKRDISMQFEARQTEKVYEALLRGVLKEDEGVIDLPIRLDTDNRPYQIVDHEKGKSAITHFRRLRVEVLNGEKVTRVLFFPRTGRTHQIRVHAASGLGLPIVGDRLYGERKEGERLCLHARSLSFIHPDTLNRVTFESEPEF